MDATSTVISNEIFGTFELDDHGYIRYSRPAGNGDGQSMIGQSFFELVGQEHSDDLRRHFRRFIESHHASDTFTFDYFSGPTTIRAKVMMTRAFQTDDFPPESIVMVDIRESNF